MSLKLWLYVGAAGLALLLITGSYVKGRSDGADKVRAEVALQVQKANEHTLQIETQARAASAEVDRDYQAKLAELDARYRDAVGRIGPVRVRQCPRGGEVPAVAGAASGDHGAAGRNELPRAAGDGPDVGPGLVELVRDADIQTVRLIACQDYVVKVQRAFAANR